MEKAAAQRTSISRTDGWLLTRCRLSGHCLCPRIIPPLPTFSQPLKLSPQAWHSVLCQPVGVCRTCAFLGAGHPMDRRRTLYSGKLVHCPLWVLLLRIVGTAAFSI